MDLYRTIRNISFYPGGCSTIVMKGEIVLVDASEVLAEFDYEGWVFVPKSASSAQSLWKIHAAVHRGRIGFLVRGSESTTVAFDDLFRRLP